MEFIGLWHELSLAGCYNIKQNVLSRFDGRPNEQAVLLSAILPNVTAPQCVLTISENFVSAP